MDTSCLGSGFQTAVAGRILTCSELIRLLSSNFVSSQGHLKFLPTPLQVQASNLLSMALTGFHLQARSRPIAGICRALLGTEPELKIDIDSTTAIAVI